MEKNLHLVFNEPVSDETAEALLDAIIAWVKARGLTICAVIGEEGEEAGNVEKE